MAAAVSAVYATCRTYEDSGAVTTTATADDGHVLDVSRTTFQTAFERKTRRFRFRFTRGSAHGQVWADGASARLWWTREPGVATMPLADALGVIAGVSSGTSHFIPDLILTASNWVMNSGLETVAEEEERGLPTLRLGKTDGRRTVSVWIHRTNHYVTKWSVRERIDRAAEPPIGAREGMSAEEILMFQERHVPFIVESTAELTATFDHDLAGAALEYLPP